MKTRLLIIIVSIIITSSVIFVFVWNIPGECDEKCALEPRQIEAGQGAQGIFEPNKASSHLSLELTQKLKNARDILSENQDTIPWTGLGVSTSEKAVTISIDDKNPENYRKIIEELVGNDVPVIIKKGGDPFMDSNLASQQVIERLKQKPQTAVGPLDAQYIESLALQDPVIANFVEKIDWTSHCCGFSESNDRIELSITFLDESNDRQLAVTIDLDTLKIINTDNKKTVYMGGPGRTDYPYQQISIKEAPNRSHYYHKITSLDEIQYLSEIYKNGTKIITTNEFQEFYDVLSKRCIENNLENADLCENTKLAFEYDSKEYRFVNQGVENED